MATQASSGGMIRDNRPRQLRDEGKSCGIQPTNISMIDRRYSRHLARPARRNKQRGSEKEEAERLCAHLTGQSISATG